MSCFTRRCRREVGLRMQRLYQETFLSRQELTTSSKSTKDGYNRSPLCVAVESFLYRPCPSMLKPGWRMSTSNPVRSMCWMAGIWELLTARSSSLISRPTVSRRRFCNFKYSSTHDESGLSSHSVSGLAFVPELFVHLHPPFESRPAFSCIVG